MSDQTPETAADATQQQPPAQEATEETTDWKAEARKWEARSRQNHNDLKALQNQFGQFRSGIANSLGITTEEADPKKLAENLTAAQREATAARRESAVMRRARANGANPDALADSASFLRSLNQVDPADTDAIDAAIKRAVENNPTLSAAPQPGAGYSDTTAGRTSNHTSADAEALKILGF